jgi:uncharacterized protein YhfF
MLVLYCAALLYCTEQARVLKKMGAYNTAADTIDTARKVICLTIITVQYTADLTEVSAT